MPPDILRKIAKAKHTGLIYFLYNLVLLVSVPLISLYFLGRIRKDRRYARRFAERLGRLPFSPEVTPAPPIWLHAVSVGEILSSVEVVRRLRSEYPAARIYISVTTVAGRALAEDKLRGLVDGLFYAPIDYRSCVRRVLGAIRPGLVVVLETEIWPNLYREVKRTGSALVIVNGRISDRALPKYRRARPLFVAALAWPDRILVQTVRDRERYVEIGAPPETTRVGGNLKYDFRPGTGEVPEIAHFLQRTGPGAIWIAASTMPPADKGDVDEDDAVIQAFRTLAGEHPNLLLILVPRRPERFDVAAGKLEQAGIAFARRSQLTEHTRVALPGVLLLDSVGELSRTFPAADVVFMGGTLARRGGHNILEPAFFGKPVVIGPHMENFAEIGAEFRAARAVVEIESAADLAGSVHDMLGDAARRARVGAAAQRLAVSKQGVTEAIAAQLLELYFRAVPRRSGSILLAPLAAIWRAGTKWDRERKSERRRRLSTRVVSIGNITLGGAGKTPMAAWLAAKIKAQGLEPAILTRGYRRRSPETSIVVPAGTPATADVTGDEAQIYVRTGRTHVGIGADRFETGRLAEDLLHPGIFILDDGFQHWRLHRDLDIVLIDAIDPFGRGYLFPRGRLREPVESLARADAFVITRTEPALRTDGIEARLREHNPSAPIFRSRVVARQWVNAATGEAFDARCPPFQAVAAFCGLANPAGFWRTLGGTGVGVPLRWEFGDHHFYRSRELQRFVARALATTAEALVTTEKDAMNLPAGFAGLVKPLPLYYLEISVELDDPAALISLCLGNATRLPASTD